MGIVQWHRQRESVHTILTNYLGPQYLPYYPSSSRNQYSCHLQYLQCFLDTPLYSQEGRLRLQMSSHHWCMIRCQWLHCFQDMQKDHRYKSWSKGIRYWRASIRVAYSEDYGWSWKSNSPTLLTNVPIISNARFISKARRFWYITCVG